MAKFVKDLLNQSFYGIVGLEEFKIPKKNKISLVYYISCPDSRDGREWIENYWINKLKLKTA